MLPSFRFGSPNVCAYCGDIPIGIDHVFCIASQTNRRRKGRMINGFGPTTYSCIYCNSTLGDKRFDFFHDRCFYVHDRLLYKTGEVLWTDKEISELDYSLQRYVQRKQDRRKWFNWRVNWYDTRDFMLNLESLLWEPTLDKTSPKFHEEIFNYFNQTMLMVKMIYENKK